VLRIFFFFIYFSFIDSSVSRDSGRREGEPWLTPVTLVLKMFSKLATGTQVFNVKEHMSLRYIIQFLKNIVRVHRDLRGKRCTAIKTRTVATISETFT
jgi:hypothetical protein